MEHLKERMQSGSFDWGELRKNIHAAHGNAVTTEDRVLCLGIHKAVMDLMEGQIAPENMQEFREARSEDYNLLLLKEVMVGKTDGLVDPVKMAEITRREVAAGRMTADEDLHALALAGVEVFGRPSPSKKSDDGFLGRLFSWLKS